MYVSIPLNQLENVPWAACTERSRSEPKGTFSEGTLFPGYPLFPTPYLTASNIREK